jgi:hypothetical protein
MENLEMTCCSKITREEFTSFELKPCGYKLFRDGCRILCRQHGHEFVKGDVNSVNLKIVLGEKR